MNQLTVLKRDQKRSRVYLAVEVHLGSGPVTGHIRDLSANGALVESDWTPSAGETIELQCGKTAIPARVAWVERGWFGVEFEKPLMMTRLVDSAGARLKVSAPRYYRSGELPE